MFALRYTWSICYKSARLSPFVRRLNLSKTAFPTFAQMQQLENRYIMYTSGQVTRPASLWRVQSYLEPRKDASVLKIAKAEKSKCAKDTGKGPCSKKKVRKPTKGAIAAKKAVEAKGAQAAAKKAKRTAAKKAPATPKKKAPKTPAKKKQKSAEKEKKPLPKTGGLCGARVKRVCGETKKLKKNIAAVLHCPEEIKLDTVKLPKITSKEVLVYMDCVGICGADVDFYQHGRIGSIVVRKPMILGHEGSGIVLKLGKKIKHLKVGDRVAIEPGEPCRYCPYCKRGAYNLCPKMKFCATPPVHGLLMRYFKHPGDFCYKLPDHVTMEEGALLEPLAVGVAACRRSELRLGQTALILGAGPIGLMTLLAAKAMGASKVYVIDKVPERLALAKKLGASEAMVVCEGYTPEEMAQQMRETMGSLPHKTFDCVGSNTTAKMGVAMTRTGGTCVLVGLESKPTKLPLEDSLMREIDLRGVFRYCNDYPGAVHLMSSGRINNIKYLVTNHFDFKETKKAFELASKRKGKTVKILIHVQKRDKNNKKPFDSFKSQTKNVKC